MGFAALNPSYGLRATGTGNARGYSNRLARERLAASTAVAFRSRLDMLADINGDGRRQVFREISMDRRDFLLSGTLAAATITTTTGPVLAQNSPATDAGMQQPPPSTAPYKASEANQKLKIVNLPELEPEAQKILPAGGFGYISSGSGANWTRRENMAAYERIQIDPQPLGGTEKVDLTVEILGSKLAMPVIVPPMGSHGLA